jgi:hypothetical protein
MHAKIASVQMLKFGRFPCDRLSIWFLPPIVGQKYGLLSVGNLIGQSCMIEIRCFDYVAAQLCSLNGTRPSGYMAS